MFKFHTFSLVFSILFISIFIGFNANAQIYLPVGPQTNVPVETVTGGGWTECYRDTYNHPLDASTVLSQCRGNELMLSCRPTGSSTLALLAQGDRSDVTFDTGVNTDVLHVANGVGWYFNNTGTNSWGFVRAGDSVEKVNCDDSTSGANDERLCWHLIDNGGFRCGAATGLNSSDSFERIVYTAGPLGRVTPIPTLSERGTVVSVVVLGLVGMFFLIKRRKRGCCN